MHLTVLDVSGAALKQAQARLRERANLVRWIEADFTGFRADRRFRMIGHVDETHITPWQSEQRFSFFRLLRFGD